MKRKREPVFVDLMFVLGGVLGVAIAIGRLGNDIVYLPNDVRSQPWFDPFVSSVIAVFSLFFIIVGTIRLIRGFREPPTQD